MGMALLHPPYPPTPARRRLLKRWNGWAGKNNHDEWDRHVHLRHNGGAKLKKKDPQKVAAAQARAAALSPERRREISKLGVAARQGNQGEHNGNAKLSEADVRRIKERLASGETNAEIAATYGVTGDLIRKIKRGTLWRNVPGPGASETPE